MDFKVQSVFLDLRCAFYQQVNLDREKHGIYFSNFKKDFEGKKMVDFILYAFPIIYYRDLTVFNLRCLMNM